MHTLAVNEQGTHVHVDGEALLLSREGHVLRRVRLREIDQVLVFGRMEISSVVILALARRPVDLVFLSLQGSFRARLATHGSKNLTLPIAQVQRSLESTFCAVVT